MSIRTIAELKSYFQGFPVTDRPSAQHFTDLFDTLQWYEDMVNAAIAAASPVIIVPDQATMLANGPTYSLGQRVKHTDEGLAWIKQQQTGAVIENWAPIGDVAVTIPDVLTLQTELDNRFTRDLPGEACVGRLGVRNISQPQIGTWQMVSSSPVEVQIRADGASLNYGVMGLSEDVLLRIIGSGTFYGRSVTGFLCNISGSAIEVALSAGMLGTNGNWPVTLGAGKWMSVTATWINHPVEGDLVLMAFNHQT